MKEKATTGVDFHQVTENLALWVVVNSQQSVTTVTQGKKDTVLESPQVPKTGTLICIPYLARLVSWS
jgi:hypothetical protein